MTATFHFSENWPSLNPSEMKFIGDRIKINDREWIRGNGSDDRGSPRKVQSERDNEGDYTGVRQDSRGIACRMAYGT